MNRSLAHMLVRLYPRRWRQRYGQEFAVVLEEQPMKLRAVFDVLRGALTQRLTPTDYGDATMTDPTGTVLRFVRLPSALVPIALSLAALSVVVVSLALSNWTVVHERDEGAAAHLWQLCMAAQVPILVYFAFKWIPIAPKQALLVLGLQLCAALLAAAPVYLLRL